MFSGNGLFSSSVEGYVLLGLRARLEKAQVIAPGYSVYPMYYSSLHS